MQRRRYRNTLTFPDRNCREAERLRCESKTKIYEPEQIRQAETALHVNE